ncbi:MAG: sigma-70 family RNA polymerase sigma factor [Chloroflexi bacterium]|nr:sigma-70 family RNA polymerase sigma factor [Chloroflexota bacterium]
MMQRRWQDREEVVALLEKAELQGYLMTEDIMEAYPDAQSGQADVPRLLAFLRGAGIDVFDGPEEIPADLLRPRRDEASGEFDLAKISIDDTVGLYLKEMARVPLLTTQQEVSLAKRVERGGLAAARLDRMRRGSVRRGSARGVSRRAELEGWVEDGRLAREHLIKANTRLVVSIAKRYIGRGVPFLDLIQEGNLGLMKAVEKYDYHRGFRFSTYATWWIRQTISRAIADQSRTIRVPVHMTDRIRRLYRTSHELEQRLSRKPTNEELAGALGLEQAKVEWMLKVSWRPISLESPVGEDDDEELIAFVEDHITPSPTESAYEHLLSEKVEEVLSTLSPREARVLRLRFGLSGERAYTLEEVGEKFGLTRERIRQIEGRALRRMRHPRRARQLRDYAA